MEKLTQKLDRDKTKPVAILEMMLLFGCLAVMAIKVAAHENMVTTAVKGSFDTSLFSLCSSMVIVVLFSLWLVVCVFAKRGCYRFTGLEIVLAMFVLAAIKAFLAASDKRIAMTSLIAIATPILLAILLVQLLDSAEKVRLAMMAVAAVAVVCSFEIWSQYAIAAPEMIAKYEANQTEVMEGFGVKPGTINHAMLEERIYSQKPAGFFMTSNSAATFILLGVFTLFALIAKWLGDRNRKDKLKLVSVAAMAGFLAMFLFALFVTKSKGAILAFAAASVASAGYVLLANVIKRKPKIATLLVVICIAAIALAVVGFGRSHNTLPGGVSMQLRWQYWTASAKMFSHNVTGVGGGNFANHYYKYKMMGAVEDVADPHNFILSLLCQFGIVGCLSFVGIVVLIVTRLFGMTKVTVEKSKAIMSTKVVAAAALVIGLVIALKPIVTQAATLNASDIAGEFILSIIRAIIFMAGFMLMAIMVRPKNDAKIKNNVFVNGFLAFGLFAVLLQNMVDFSIFEPSIFTAFCVILSCFLATFANNSSVEKQAGQCLSLSTKRAKITAVAIAVVLPVSLFSYGIAKPVKAFIFSRKAEMTAPYDFDKACEYFKIAADSDKLSNAALINHSNFIMKKYLAVETNQKSANEVLPYRAGDLLIAAAKRNPICFQTFEKLVNIYSYIEKYNPDSLNMKMGFAQQGLYLYPNSSYLRFALAKTAKKLGDEKLASENYAKVVKIEKAYKKEFAKIYPNRKPMGKLSQKQYDIAVAKQKRPNQ